MTSAAAPLFDPVTGIQVWLARPSQVRAAHWRDLEALLDDAERVRAARFKIVADRCAFILAHALRRVVLAQVLGTEPSVLQFADEPGAKPALLAPESHGCYFSHSRRRSLVAVAVAPQPVGIDVEAVHGRAVDFGMLSRFVDLPDSEHVAELARDPARQFFFYWTALEAFWKLRGTGLASGHARMHCERVGAGQHLLSLEGDSSTESAVRLVTFDAAPGHAIALAVQDSRSRAMALEQAEISWRSFYQLVH